MPVVVLVVRVQLPAHPDGDADDHGGHGDAGEQGDPDRRPNQRAQLADQLLLPRPRLLAPERAAGGRQVVQV